MTAMLRASQSAEFENALTLLEPGLHAWLRARDLLSLHIWGFMVVEAESDVEILDAAQNFLQLAGVDLDSQGTWAGQLMFLYRLACGEAEGMARRLANVSEFQIAIDSAELAKEQVAAHQAGEQKRLELQALARLPTEWRGKRYRRLERAENETERTDLAQEELLKEGRQVMGLLLEAGLPFAKTLENTGTNETGAMRCCVGLRPKTLRQRLACWRPVRRWLLGEGLPAFPSDVAPLLRYLELRRKAGAGRTVFKIVQLALNFFEEAGEVPRLERLANHPALTNLVKESGVRTAFEEAARKEESSWLAPPTDQSPPNLLRLLVGFERVVNDTGRPLYQRAFAWFRLARHWDSLRWDDTQSVRPASFSRYARGLYATLEVSKTSGPGKKVRVLPIFLSQEAWIERPWLDAGWRLWQEDSLNFKRDYFLPLPTGKLDGARRTKAGYTDSHGFSRALLLSLAKEDSTALLHLASVSFWSEHTDRAGLTSWCSALRIGVSERGFLGRWAAKGSADQYARTACRIVENLQVVAARHARASWKGGPDFFGEETTLKQLEAHLRGKGVAEDEILEQLAELTAPDFYRPVPQMGSVLTDEVRSRIVKMRIGSNYFKIFQTRFSFYIMF